MVPLKGIEPSTSALPMMRSTNELQRLFIESISYMYLFLHLFVIIICMITRKTIVPKRTPAFMAFSAPIFCLLLVFAMKNALLVLEVQKTQYRYMEDKKKVEQIKGCILHYFKDRQHFPKTTAAEEIDYETYISYYVPSIYRQDYKNRGFKVTFYTMKYRHPEQTSISMEKDEDIYKICTIHNEDKSISISIFENELQQLITKNNSSITLLNENSQSKKIFKSQEPSLDSIAKMLNQREKY